MKKQKADPRRTNDVDRAAEKVATDGRSLERLAALTGIVLKVPVEEVREAERQDRESRTRR